MSRGKWDRRSTEQERRDVARRRIADATARAVVERGAAVTAGDIVELAGVGRNTFYELFDSAADAVDEVSRLAVDATMEALKRAALPARTPRERMRALTLAWLEEASSRPLATILALGARTASAPNASAPNANAPNANAPNANAPNANAPNANAPNANAPNASAPNAGGPEERVAKERGVGPLLAELEAELSAALDQARRAGMVSLTGDPFRVACATGAFVSAALYVARSPAADVRACAESLADVTLRAFR